METFHDEAEAKGGREPWKRPGAISHPSCQRAQKEGRGRAFSFKGRMWNADHRLEESTIQSVSLPCALSGLGGICQVKTVANVFWGAWNTDKENQVWRMRADLDHNNCDTLLLFLLVLDIMRMILRSIFKVEKCSEEWEHLWGNELTLVIQLSSILISLQKLFLCATTPS